MNVEEIFPEQVAAVRSWGRRMHDGALVTFVRQRTNAYKILVDLDDKTVAGVIGAGAVIWLIGWVFSGASGMNAAVRALTGALLLVLWLGASTVTVVWWTRYRLSPARLRHELLARDGMARTREINDSVGAKAVVARGARVRPTLAATRKLNPQDVSWQLGHSRAVPTHLSSEVPQFLVGPARSGKGLDVLISSIVEAPGAVVSTSTRADNMATSILERAKRGPVYLFDPERVSGRATTLRWSPFAGCEDPAVAQRRAATLVARTGLGGENQVWATSAGGIVQALLHAAAVGHVSIHDLHRWSKSPTQARAAMKILEERSPERWGLTIESVIGDDARMRSNKWFGVETAFSCLDVSTVRELFDVDPRDPDAFDVARFLKDSGSLYMVSRWRDTASVGASVGGFFSLLLDQITETARDLSQKAPSGRLEPPVSLVLDEIANIHPWPALPRAMAAGSGEGVVVLAGFQSRAQAREAYGQDQEQSMWDNSSRILLGGSMDEQHLRELSAMLGERTRVQRSRSWSMDRGLGGGTTNEQENSLPLVSPDELRRLPEHTALLVAGRARPMLVDLVSWHERPWADGAQASLRWHKEHPAIPGQVAATYSAASA